MSPNSTTNIDIIDLCYKLSMIAIAVLNLSYAIYVFKFKNKKEDSDKERDRKINWLKTIILDYNLEVFYDFFKNSHLELCKLKSDNLADEDKSTINDNLATLFISLRRDFTDTFLAVDDRIYDEVMFKTDSLQDFLTNEIFTDTNNFNDDFIFQEIVEQSLSTIKREILKILFSYRG